MEPRTPWNAAVFLLLLLFIAAVILLEVKRWQLGAWQPLPGHDGGGGGGGGSAAVQMRSIAGPGLLRQAEGTPLLHSPHTLE